MCPKTIRDKSNAVFQRICSKIPSGLIIFDRGFARRKVFTMALRFGHHILCRAKSNAVFYQLPKIPKHRKRGRPKKYGDRLSVHRMRYQVIEIAGKAHSVASKVVRTKMCDADVRLVVIRTRPKPSKSYQYFFVFTTDMTLEVPQIVQYYRNRWQIETAFRDVKQNFGFNKYQVKSRKSINRFVQLSFNVKNTNESANGEVYPPKEWYLTEDPELRAKYLYDILLKQFGDKPEVHTIGKYEQKAAKGIVPTLDEYITYLEAHLSLWPNKTTRETLEEVLKMKDEGKNIIFVGWDE